MGGSARGGTTFRANIEVVEAMGSELYAHFAVSSDISVESDELRELAADAGAGDVPSSGREGHIVARLDPASKVREGEEAELWVDASQAAPVRARHGRQPHLLTSARPEFALWNHVWARWGQSRTPRRSEASARTAGSSLKRGLPRRGRRGPCAAPTATC